MQYILENEAINDNGCFATGGIGSSIGVLSYHIMRN